MADRNGKNRNRRRRIFTYRRSRPESNGIETKPIAHRVRVTSDRFDRENVNRLRETCAALVEPDLCLLMLDLTAVNGSSALVACIVELRKLARETGFSLAVRPSTSLREWMRLFRLEDLIRESAA